jgi:hypothetical protein
MAYGTHSTLDTLAGIRNTTVAQYGEDRVWEGIAASLAAHNRIQAELAGELIERTTDRLRNFGGSDDMTMEEIDQFGRPDAQKITAGVDVGFPLRLYGGSLQWTRKYLQNAMVGEIAASVQAMMAADVRVVNREIKKAIFTATSNTSYTDRLVDNVTLPIRALVNADSTSIPPGPNGEAFTASSHTHYLARAGGALAASDVSALIDTVIEHHQVGEARLYINSAQESAIRGFTSNFTAYVDARIRPALDTQVGTRTLDVNSVGNRAIGIFDEAEVWVKPWVPASYLFAFVAGSPAPLVWRTRRNDSGDLELVAEDELHPLRARTYEREFGIGVWNRTNGAVLYAGDTTYATPTITS